jgi:hypothetical protein
MNKPYDVMRWNDYGVLVTDTVTSSRRYALERWQTLKNRGQMAFVWDRCGCYITPYDF